MRHINFFFLGGLGGGQKVYVERVYVLLSVPYFRAAAGKEKPYTTLLQ